MKIAKCIFLSSESKGHPSGKTQYDYFVPDHIKFDHFETIGVVRRHAVVLGGDGVYAVVRVVQVDEIKDKRGHRETKELIALVDDTAYLAGKERAMRAQEIVSELKRMDRQWREMERIRAMGAVSPEAKALVEELEGLSKSVPKGLVVDFANADLDD
jgi:hypothetical protein